jgi:hypothetical protein
VTGPGGAAAPDGALTGPDDAVTGPGHTWWGRAWVDALEQRARLDPNRLPRGRDYARSGAVGELVLAPGEVRARVQGRLSQPYEVRVRVRQYGQGEWDRVLGAISAQLGRAAALLDGELPPEIAADVAAAGLDLLPGAGEVGPRCTCPDEADPCKHAAAVCYLVADALDADPFAVLLLRGRTRGEVLAGLRSRRRGAESGQPTAPDPGGVRAGTGRAGEAPGPGTGSLDNGGPGAVDPGVDARAALAGPPPLGPVPIPPMPPRRPGHPAALPVDPPSWRAGLREDLLELATDASWRAWELTVGFDTEAGLSLDADADLARRADRALGTPAFATLAGRCGIDGRELARRGLAWRHGGLPGLDVLRDGWDPGDVAGAPDLLKAARAALRDLTTASARVTGNHVTAGHLQLRLGRDLLWYPYARSDGEWEPAGPPQADPTQAAGML